MGLSEKGDHAQRTDHHNREIDRSTYTSAAVITEEIPRPNVHVAWNRTGGSGALGVQHDIGWMQLGIDVSIADLRSTLVAAEAEAEAEAWTFRVMSDVMDRRETNLAIATLRRARDTAYGKDA